MGTHSVIASNWDYFAILSNTPCIQTEGSGFFLNRTVTEDEIDYRLKFYTGFFDINVICDFGRASLHCKDEDINGYQKLVFKSDC